MLYGWIKVTYRYDWTHIAEQNFIERPLTGVSFFAITKKNVHFWQSHLHRDLLWRLSFPQAKELQSSLHLHLTNSLVDFPTSGIVIQTGIHSSFSDFQPNSPGVGEGYSGCEDASIHALTILEIGWWELYCDIRFLCYYNFHFFLSYSRIFPCNLSSSPVKLDFVVTFISRLCDTEIFPLKARTSEGDRERSQKYHSRSLGNL